MEELDRAGCVIRLASSELLRVVKKKGGKRLSFREHNALMKERKQIVRGADCEKGRERIKAIDAILLKSEFVDGIISVKFESKSAYRKYGKNGFAFNGEHYERLMCGAAHARTNRAIFCKSAMHEELDKIIRCGCADVDIVPAKWNAYYALVSTATFRVRTPRVCVVDDCEIKMRKPVDFVVDGKFDDDIEFQERELDFNLWDGMGLISPEFASLWSLDLRLDYLPGGFLIRAPFIKGMVAVFDFHRFAKEKAANKKLKDIYGREYDESEIDIILTKSQFKLWNGYTSWQQYESAREGVGLSWGVSKVTPKASEEKNYARTNYQFVQTLDMGDADIAELCKPTEDWINGCARNEYGYMLLYLLGKVARYGEAGAIWDRVQDPFIKALMLRPELLSDEYIHGRIVNSLRKRMKESYIGKLIVRGNFQTLFSDPYGLCEHAFGLEVKGLLKEDEHYCKYWLDKGVDRVCGLRSPMTWRSEVTELHFKSTDEQKEWYKYIDSGIIVNTWGNDFNLWSGADVDGDILFTTDNPVYLRCRAGGVPVIYEKKKPAKQKIKNNQLYKIDLLGFDTKVGFLTNLSTTMYEMQTQYDPSSEEWQELQKRLKLCCYHQNAIIDGTKGLIIKPIPKYWTKRQKIYDTDTKEIIAWKELCNKLVVDKRPKFMKYLYSGYSKEYNAFIADFDRYARVKWGNDYEHLSDRVKESADYKEYEAYRELKNPLLETKGVMGKVCDYMETHLKDIKRKSSKYSGEYFYNLLKSGKISESDDRLAKMRDLRNEYLDFKKGKKLADSMFATYEQYYKNLRLRALEEISNSIGELADLALCVCYYENPKKPKDFVWDLFGMGIVENLLAKDNTAHIPVLDELGEVEYLYEKYAITHYSVIPKAEVEFNEVPETTADGVLSDVDTVVLDDLDDIFSDVEVID